MGSTRRAKLLVSAGISGGLLMYAAGWREGARRQPATSTTQATVMAQKLQPSRAPVPTTQKPVTAPIRQATTPTPAPTATEPTAVAVQLGEFAFLSARVLNEQSVAGVQFVVDVTPIGDERTSPPFVRTWDVGEEDSGIHSVSAVIRFHDGSRYTTDPTPFRIAFSGQIPDQFTLQGSGPSQGGDSDATGLCRDGTHTTAAHRQGACSYHDGVADYWG